MSNDKQIEYDRYNRRSLQELETGAVDLDKNGSDSVAESLRTPYLLYEQLIRDNVQEGTAVLDLCCGNGVHSITAAKKGAAIIATDIAENSLRIARLRAERHAVADKLKFMVADAEKLPFENNSFDVVTCAGSLSYVDIHVFLGEVDRVLKPSGKFICIDSFDHNPVYRINRFIHFLRKKRSYSTLQRMPDNRTLKIFREKFADVQVRFFGVFAFLAGAISKMLNPATAKKIIDGMDKRFGLLKRYSFKIVIIAAKSDR